VMLALAAIRPGPMTVGVLIAVFVIWRWRRLEVENKVLGVVIGLGFVVYGTGLIHPPSLDKIFLDVGKALGPYTYILVGVMAFLETGAFVGLVAPGETVVIVGGFVAGQGEINIVILIGIVWFAAVCGDTASFLLGRRLGREFLLKHGPRLRITEERLERVEGFLHRHGGTTILFGRFIGLVRALAPFVAGASRLPLRRFLPYDIIAAGAWATVFSLLGYIFWRSFNRVIDIAKKGALAFATVAGVIVGGIALYRYLRVPANRARVRRFVDEQADRPAVRPLARVVRPLYRRVLLPAWRRIMPVLRFLWERVTPGQLGLELTTLLAVASVGSFVFFGLASLVDDGDSLRSDSRAFDVVSRIRMDWLDDVVKALTNLGSPPVVGIAVFVTAVFLLSRRRITEALSLTAGMILTYSAVHIAKAAIDRPRPSDGLIDATGSAFPSAHAAYSVAYVAIALAVAYAFPRFIHRAVIVTVAIVLTALIGLSRVYLRVHYLSDVMAGWGLAAALFSICAIVGLIVAAVRHNEMATQP
jgi:membrane protein DedA with SNARE-associated domain/membrane-associated phospholipid phosphatase